MEDYGLLTKDGEIISKVKCKNLSEAIDSFEILKRLSKVLLLEIYMVVPIKE